jgi:hypothetical protein
MRRLPPTVDDLVEAGLIPSGDGISVDRTGGGPGIGVYGGPEDC